MTALELVEEVLGGWGDAGVQGDALAVDLDGGCAQGLQGSHESSGAQAGAGLQVAGDGHGREHDGEVSFDGVFLVKEHRLCRRLDYADVSVLMPARAGYAGCRSRHNQSWKRL